MPPPKLFVVNFPINFRCYVLLGCRVINVILAINIGDSAFFDIAALVRQFGGLRHHQQTESIHWPPPQTKILATPLPKAHRIYHNIDLFALYDAHTSVEDSQWCHSLLLLISLSFVCGTT